MTSGHSTPEFGSLLRSLRITAGLTQAELAERAGLSSRGVQDLERGVRRSPHPDTVRRLVSALDLTDLDRAALIGHTQSSSGRLPLSPTPLVGRLAELEVGRAYVLQQDIRLLTLTGVGGSGKTRLALALAEQLRSPFDDLVYFVDLAPLEDPAAVLPAIARVLGARELGTRSPGAVIRDALENQRVLVLLDNLEHLLPAAAVAVADLLTQCPGLHLLATSREALHVSWEQELTVPPLPVPDPQVLPQLEELALVPSVALFLLRARSVDSTFAVTTSNAQAVAEICVRLDGLPLAVELAAARVKYSPPHELAALLQHRLALLVDGPRDFPRRQQTLRDALAWSYDLLDPDEQRLFRVLSVCSGGADRATVTRLGATFGDNVDALRLVISLVDKSLLLRTVANPEGLRVSMLQTVREFAVHELGKHGEVARVARAHAEHFLALAEDASLKWDTPDAPTWLDRLEREHVNLQAALAWFIEQHQAKCAWRLASSLAWFWRTRGYASEGRAQLEASLDLEPDAPASPQRAAALHEAGELARILALYDVAEERLTQALAVYRVLGDPRGIVLTLVHLAGTARFQRHYASARVWLDEALPIAHESGDPLLLRRCLIGLGALATNEGDFRDGSPWLIQALTLANQHGDIVGQVQALCYLGIIATHLGEYAAAEAQLRRALDVNERLGDQDYFATLFDALAGLAGVRGQFRRALMLIGAADRVLHDVGTRSLPPIRQARRETWLASARAALGHQAADADQRAGHSLDLEAAVKLALEAAVSDVPRASPG